MSGRGDRRVLGAVAAGLLVAVAIGLAIVGGSGGDRAIAVETPPHFVDAHELGELEASLGHSAYWAGERPPARLELRQEAEGSVYLRYLPPGVKPGDPDQTYLTIGTYPVVDAVAALERSAAESEVEVEPGPGDGVVLRNPDSRGSVYLAYPGSDVQIEVYDPVPGRSLHLIRSGAIVPVGG
ncbi:MAG TPA: hypothetical protein VMT37_04230 [Solirubrobacterales bacterium]|nr:hypothetical protein [Solirubrobacterales bacterium]